MHTLFSLSLSLYIYIPVSKFSIADFVLLETSTILNDIATNSFFLLTLCHHRKSVASKLHGVEVEIKVIKRKGDPLYDDNISSSGIVEATTPANEMATACLHQQQPPPRQRQQLSRQQQQGGVSEQQCRENRDDNKLLSNNINNANILSNSNINSSNSISSSQGNLSFFPSTFFLAFCAFQE